ncbi:MAG: MCP four helix bundle domain-containing protein, partial [Alphaproteobacteria bacterium]
MQNNLFSTFNNLRIATKIGIGFLMVLALFIVTSALNYRSLINIGNDNDIYRQRVEVTSLVSKLNQSFLNVQRFAREFSSTGDEAHIASLKIHREATSKTLKHALEFIQNPERHGLIKQIDSQFREYDASTDKIIALRKEQDKLIRDVIDPLGEKTLQLFSKIEEDSESTNNFFVAESANKIVREIIKIRLYITKMIVRHDNKLKESVKT